MTARTLTGETPFKLIFGIEAVIPVEVGMSSLRQKHYDDHGNDKELQLALDCLSKVKGNAAQKMALYDQRMTNYHDQRVKLRRFNPGDMVLQKVSHATKDPA